MYESVIDIMYETKENCIMVITTGPTVAKTAVDLVKNENVLNKTVDALGMLFPYAGITKKAVDMYIAEIEKSDMPIDTKMYALLNAKKQLKQMKNQKKIAEIAMQNVKEETSFTYDCGVNEEWLERFMDSAAYVSDENIQLIWGKILSNEFDNPGTTPPNMIRILSEMTPMYAKAFRQLCSMRILLVSISNTEEITGAYWKIVVPYNENHEFMSELGISFQMLNELETLGVIKFDPVAGYISKGIDDKKILIYANGKTMEITKHDVGSVPIGNVIMTSAGEVLKNITTPEDIDKYDEAIKKYMKLHSVMFNEEEGYQVLLNENTVHVINGKKP